MLKKDVEAALKKGQVIPAHPLALTAERKLDARRQQALSRYYIATGAGGLAVGVHTTQFEIRDPKWDLYRPVLELTACVMDADAPADFIRVAGIVGNTRQAVAEAEVARDCGYEVGLVSLRAFANAGVDAMVAHCRAIADVIPVMGFYLQPAVGGCVLPFDFWRRFAEIESVVGIKIAPFNRYQTLDVIRGVVAAGRVEDIALYTGNDDNIVMDLLTSHRFVCDGACVDVRIVGGLLGHWAVWTKKAVEILRACHEIAKLDAVPQEMLTRAIEVTDCNAALFDVANDFHGCIAGVHEVLRRQGLLEGVWCLNPEEGLSPGQMEEIDRVYAAYPHLNDDDFVAEHLDAWLR
ncbi:MAG: dihydrodipicolinate synthase family protein [Gemmatimonadetes bacterium]|nr:dihydrodipicolinate synthase family protein [Gemmatimonadota bacterium]MYB56523.1 dihydrodipicolinate synthase family protein [Gemmatimonadota bacterium]